MAIVTRRFPRFSNAFLIALNPHETCLISRFRTVYDVQFIRRNSTSADVCPSVRTVRIPCRLSTRIVNRDRSVEKDRREEVSIKRKREVHAHAHWKGCTRCFFLVIKDQRHDPARQAGNTCRPRQMTSVLVNIRWILLSYGGQSLGSTTTHAFAGPSTPYIH